MLSNFPELTRLSPDEKLILAAELLSEFSDGQTLEEPDPEIVAILEERMQHYRKNPSTALSWEEVKQKICGNG